MNIIEKKKLLNQFLSSENSNEKIKKDLSNILGYYKSTFFR